MLGGRLDVALLFLLVEQLLEQWAGIILLQITLGMELLARGIVSFSLQLSLLVHNVSSEIFKLETRLTESGPDLTEAQ